MATLLHDLRIAIRGLIARRGFTAVAVLTLALGLGATTALSALERQATARPRFYLALLGVLAVLAVTLAAVGVYGVVAYAVSQRTREIGLRMALGARSPEVVRLVVWEGLRPVTLGTLAGIAGALAGGRFLADLLHEVQPRDPATMIAVVCLLLAIALTACIVPAWAATRIPPASALRSE